MEYMWSSHLRVDSSYLFGGKQVVLVGDFLQLRPVANFFDLGRFLFEQRSGFRHAP